MSRIIVDPDLHSWEVYASGGKFGLPDQPKIIFNCTSQPDRRARFFTYTGDNADAQQAVQELPEPELQRMLREAPEVD